jgi:hypothetical protein
MTVFRQLCPFHADEDLRGLAAGDDEGSLSFTCPGPGRSAPLPSRLPSQDSRDSADLSGSISTGPRVSMSMSTVP